MRKYINNPKMWGAALVMSALCLTACNDLADNDHNKVTVVPNTNTAIQASDQTVAQYVQGRADLSKMSQLFQQQGIYDKMPEAGEFNTLLVVTNDHYATPQDPDSIAMFAKSHVMSLNLQPSMLADGVRFLMWHNKFVAVSVIPDSKEELLGHYAFASSVITEAIKAKDGYVYVLSSPISTPTSLQEYIEGLDEQKYGKFKDMVLSSGGKAFDREHSKVVGIDDNGNTIYDTVWIYTNDFFDAKNFNLSSEALTATMLLFSDEVINEALSDAKQRLHAWGYDHKMELMRNGVVDSVYVGYSSDKDVEDWILQVAFFNQRLTAEDFTPDMAAEDPTDNDLKSIYDRQWRTTVQVVDLDHPLALSNAIVYEVKHLHIPNNRLIYRLHECFNLYTRCSQEQKDSYFKIDNLKNVSVSVDEVAPWTPLAGVWPPHGDSPLTAKIDDLTKKHYGLDFTPIFSRTNNEGGYDIHVVNVPPGTYRLAMGFKQAMYDMNVQLFVIDDGGETVECAEAYAAPLSTAGTMYHYDRGAMAPKPYLPEYYDTSDPRLDESLKSKWNYYWTDGGVIYNEVEIPDLGDGKARPVMIRMWSDAVNSTMTSGLTFNHWCLRPTVNNY